MASSIMAAGEAPLSATACSRLGGLGEGRAQQRAVQRLLAAEVVVEHRLVDAGAAGDAIDAGAGVAARGELDGGGGQDALG